MDLFGIIRIVLLLIATILCCVGTGVAQLRFKQGALEVLVFLYKAGPKGGPYQKVEDYNCKAQKQIFQAAFAFAIISCVVIGFALVSVIVATFVQAFAKIGKLASVGLSVAGMITSLIAWALVVGTFHRKFCGSDASIKDAGLKLFAGAALLIVTWILMVADVVVALLGFLGIVGGGDHKAVAEANV